MMIITTYVAKVPVAASGPSTAEPELTSDRWKNPAQLGSIHHIADSNQASKWTALNSKPIGATLSASSPIMRFRIGSRALNCNASQRKPSAPPKNCTLELQHVNSGNHLVRANNNAYASHLAWDA